jgi:tetratricopeptide (TPR) repeat protein
MITRTASIVFLALLACIACHGQSSFQGLTSGKSTRANVERVLGQPVRKVSETLSEYTPLAGTGKVYVQYRQKSQVVERMEVLLLKPILRSALMRDFKLPQQSSARKTDAKGRLVEYFGGSALLVLTYATADESGGVTNIGYYSRELFNSTVASAPANQGPNTSASNIRVAVRADNANNGWTNSGLRVRRGQRLRINASGRVSLGNGRFSTPLGLSTVPDSGKLMPTEATGALIAVIGDDNDDFIIIGSRRDFVAQRDGVLFLAVNEGNPTDNTGTYDVVIEEDRESRLWRLIYEQRNFAEAYSLGRQVLADEPDNLRALIDLGYSGSQAEDKSFNTEALGHAKKAIQLIEGGKALQDWAPYKGRDDALAYVYQTVGFLNSETAPNEAIEALTKAVQLFESENTKTPSYRLLGWLHHNNTHAASQKLAGLPLDIRKPEVKALVDEVNTELDAAINYYSRYMQLSATDNGEKDLRKYVETDLISLRKYRTEFHSALKPSKAERFGQILGLIIREATRTPPTQPPDQ